MDEREFIMLQIETREAAWKAIIEQQAAEYRDLQSENARLREALEWYAQARIYEHGSDETAQGFSLAEMDEGGRARHALEPQP